MLGLHFCAQAFYSCGTLGSHCSGSSCCRAQVLGCEGFSSCDVWAQWFPRMGLAVHRYVKSSQSKHWTCVPCIARWILNNQTTWKVHLIIWFISKSVARYLAYFTCKHYSMHLVLILYGEFYTVKCINFKYVIGFDKCTHFVTQSSMKIENIIWLSFY